MMYKKLLGLFTCLPLESFNIKRLCDYTNSTKEEIEPSIKKLIKNGKIKGKKSYKLKYIPSYVRSIPTKS